MKGGTHIHFTKMERGDNRKFLGIHTKDLAWSLNTSHLAKKAQQRLLFLRKVKPGSPLSC